MALFLPGVTIDSASTADSDVTVDTPSSFFLNLPDLSNADFAQRLLRLFPRGWLGDAAQAPGGAAYGTFVGIGTTLAYVLSQLKFVASGLRVKLAYGSALDTIAVDYFGPNGLPRNPGELDPSYRSRILAMLLAPRVTRAAISNIIEITTGAAPRLAEPWTAGGDCAALDLNSYLGVDGDENVAPGRLGDGLIFTGFADISTPVSSATGGYPVYGIDIGLVLDIGTSAIDLANIASNSLPSIGLEAQVIALIQAFKAWGITVGVRFLANGALSNTVSGFLSAFSTSAVMQQQSEGVEFTLQSWLQAFGVWTEVLPWTASTYLSQRGVTFSLTTSSQPPQTYTVAWFAATFKYANPLALRVPVAPGQSSLSCTLSIPAGAVPILMTDWNSIPYITSLTPASVGISVSAAGPGNIDLLFLQGSVIQVPQGDTSFLVSSVLPPGYALYATPSWAAQMSVVKGAASFTLSFSVAAPSGAVVYVSVIANGADGPIVPPPTLLSGDASIAFGAEATLTAAGSLAGTASLTLGAQGAVAVKGSGTSFPRMAFYAISGDQAYGNTATPWLSQVSGHQISASGYFPDSGYVSPVQMAGRYDAVLIGGDWDGWDNSGSRDRADLIEAIKQICLPFSASSLVFQYTMFERTPTTLSSNPSPELNSAISTNKWYLYESAGETGTIPQDGTGYYVTNYSVAWPNAVGSVAKDAPFNSILVTAPDGVTEGPAGWAGDYMTAKFLTRSTGYTGTASGTIPASSFQDSRWTSTFNNQMKAPNLDGLYTDNNYGYPKFTAYYDLVHSDSANDYTGPVGAYMMRGTQHYVSRNQLALSKAYPSRTYLNVSNLGSLFSLYYHGGSAAFSASTNGLTQHGGALEGAMGASFSIPDSAVMPAYNAVMDYLTAPKVAMFEMKTNGQTKGSSAWYQLIRYGMATCLMDDGYYVNDDDNYDISSATWPDEAGGNPGTNIPKGWLGARVGSRPTAAAVNGVWFARFENGYVLRNPAGNGPKTITKSQINTYFGNSDSLAFFQGVQNPSLNSGAAMTSVTLQDSDGVLLRIASGTGANLVQKKSANSITATTQVTLGSAAGNGTVDVTAGNALIIIVNSDQGPEVLNSIIDSNGTLQTGIAYAGEASHPGLGVYYILNAAGGEHTITATWASAEQGNLFIMEYSGLTAFDAVSAVSFAASTSITAGPLTTAASNELVIMAVAQQGGGYTLSNYTGGFSQQDLISGTPEGAWASLIKASAGSVSGGLTSTSVNGSAAALIAFKTS